MINKAQQPENKVVFIAFKLWGVVELFYGPEKYGLT